MKKISTALLALPLMLAFTHIHAKEVLKSDFEDGTTQGWGKGSSAKKPVTVETETNGNKYIKLISAGKGSEDADKKITFHNSTGQWRGNYNVKGVKSVTVRFKNNGPDSVEMHAAFGNTLADLRTRWVVKKGIVIPNDGQWHDASFSFLPADMQMVVLGGHGKSSASFSVEETMGNVASIRFSQGTLGSETGNGHSSAGYTGWNGGPDAIADLWIDDITLHK
ncbi:MAG: hypothetical protein KAG10_02935 [Methylococcales bacterium]|nr:hypothetical protein [Methylococcales bacterium]MCK5924827.1 hypothetical protein [Methylococcales bacterium]